MRVDLRTLGTPLAMTRQLISIVIRTLNEARYLPDLLRSIGEQVVDGAAVEVVLVDSG
jgi:rhamnosyltransferase